MRKVSIFTGIVCILMFAGFYAMAQKGKPFKGIITYTISYPDSDFDANTMAMLPSTMKTKIMGSLKMNEILSGMSNQKEITDAENKTKIALIDVMGQKFAIKSTEEDIEKENAEIGVPVVEYFDDTKEIAGYTCKKAIITYKDKKGKEQSLVTYYTEEIDPSYFMFEGEYRNIKGMPLEFSMKNERVNMTFTATEVEKGGVKSKDFEVPDGYKFVTEEELKEMFGG